MFRTNYPVPERLIVESDCFGLCFFRMNLWYKVIVNGNVEAPVNCILDAEHDFIDLCDALQVKQHCHESC